MDTEEDAAALELFMNRLPVQDRVDVLVVPKSSPALENGLAARVPAGRIRVFEGEEQLTDYCVQVEKSLKYFVHRRVVSEVMQQIVNFEYAPPGELGSFRWGLLNRIGVSESAVDPVYFIKRDRISPELLGRFITTFTKLPPARRPKLVYDADKRMADGINILAAVRDSVQPYSPAPSGLTNLALPPWVAPLPRFVDLFQAGALASCAETDFVKPGLGTTVEERKRYAVLAHQKIQSLKGCDRKFDAISQSKDLVAFLRLQCSCCAGTERDWFAEAQIFALLDQAYIDEDMAGNVDEALTVAKALDDELLESFTGRYINLSVGVSPFASEVLNRSADVLARAGRFVEACYTKANKLTTDIHRTNAQPDASEWRNLVQTILTWSPYCDRLSSVLNAAGVAAMLANHLDEAKQLFLHASQANGARIHQISAEINLGIVKAVSGTGIEEDEVINIANAIEAANITKRLDYHHVYMYANLAKLSPSVAVRRYINKTLKNERYLAYSKEEVDSGQLLSFLARHFSWISDGKRFRGIRGDFVEKHDLLPICPFIWS